MDKRPLISVVILCYNQEETIARTIDSVLKQKTEFSFEIIIGEDASPSDNTRVICEEYVVKYPSIISLLPKDLNKGVIKNYSDCLAECKGKYIGTCAGDDWWHDENKLQLQVEFLENNKNYGLVYTDYRIVKIDSIGNETYFSPQFVTYQEKEIYKKLIEGNFISAGTVVYRNDIFKKYINFEDFILMDFLMEDYPMWLEMIQHTKFKHIPISTITYTVKEGSLSNNLNNIEKTEKFENSVLNIKQYYISKYPLENINSKELLEYHHRFLTISFTKERHFERAKYHSKFLNKAGIKDVVRMIICHSPLIKIYSKYLNN